MYTMEDAEDPGYTNSFDLLFRGVEITTGGQRRHDYDNLIEGIKMKGLDPEKFSYYLQAFKYGMPPHGGWGMGLSPHPEDARSRQREGGDALPARHQPYRRAAFNRLIPCRRRFQRLISI